MSKAIRSYDNSEQRAVIARRLELLEENKQKRVQPGLGQLAALDAIKWQWRKKHIKNLPEPTLRELEAVGA